MTVNANAIFNTLQTYLVTHHCQHIEYEFITCDSYYSHVSEVPITQAVLNMMDKKTNHLHQFVITPKDDFFFIMCHHILSPASKLITTIQCREDISVVIGYVLGIYKMVHDS